MLICVRPTWAIISMKMSRGALNASVMTTRSGAQRIKPMHLAAHMQARIKSARILRSTFRGRIDYVEICVARANGRPINDNKHPQIRQPTALYVKPMGGLYVRLSHAALLAMRCCAQDDGTYYTNPFLIHYNLWAKEQRNSPPAHSQQLDHLRKLTIAAAFLTQTHLCECLCANSFIQTSMYKTKSGTLWSLSNW